ncbi:MAG: hypothetical protein GWM92_00860, partial [Gemmatimonadetes bacterium]|nr:hypothetical protein [Gemmatimonadota bacterium]NIR77003.1 hypothetical protein [Gemmatimonadota bacterium]NIT85532.1 hypothetical protein [Gemmatimonadota bacterium]NIU29358.1 hypothetical protein [Gemmatimonadota bacterium]NIU34418.1 hypothetical protein [Gemmatimonadota bacterium]
MRPTVPLLAGLAALLALPVLLPAQDIPESSPDAIRTHADGLDAYLANDYGDAISRFLRAHEQDPTFYTPLFMAYLSAENAGAGDRADSLFAVVQANRFRFSGYYRGRIDVHALARQGRMSEAIEVARRTMERYPGTKAAYNYAFWVRPRDPEEALRALARLDPDREPMEGWIGYWSVRGTALQNLGDYEGMLENARATAERFPDAIGALAGQAHALAALGHFDEMEEVLDRIAALDAEQEANQLGGVLRTAGSEARAHGHEAEGLRV